MNWNKLSPIERKMGRMMRAPDGHEGDGGDGGDGDGAGAAGSDPEGEPPAGAGGEGDGGGGAAPSSSPPERPDYIPEKFWDAEKGEVRVDGLAKSYAELEKNRVNPDKLKEEWETERLAKRPEDPSGYELPKDERFDQDQLASSPIVEIWRAAAHDAGLDQEAFEGRLTEYADAFMAQTEERMKAELEALGENGQTRIDAVEKWAAATLPEEEYLALASVASSANGVKLAERMMKAFREAGMEGSGGGGDPVDGADTIEDIEKLMQTKEYYDPAHYDDKVRKRVQAFFESQK